MYIIIAVADLFRRVISIAIANNNRNSSDRCIMIIIDVATATTAIQGLPIRDRM